MLKSTLNKYWMAAFNPEILTFYKLPSNLRLDAEQTTNKKILLNQTPQKAGKNPMEAIYRDKWYTARQLAMKSILAEPLKPAAQLWFHSQEIVYGFNKLNNKYALITRTEYILQSFFLSISSLISKPIYRIFQDKVVIRLFIFISPVIEHQLDTSVKARTFWKDIVNLQLKGLHLQKDLNLFDLETREKKVFPVLSKTKDSDLEKESINNSKTSFSLYYTNSLSKLSNLFGKIFNTKVEFEIIKLQYPFHDSNILSQVLGYNGNKFNYSRLIRTVIPKAVIKNPSQEMLYTSLGVVSRRDEEEKLNKQTKLIKKNRPLSYLPPLFPNIINRMKNFPNNIVLSGNTDSNSLNDGSEKGRVLGKDTNKFKQFSSYLSGMHIRLAGRLMTQSIRPRFTVQAKQSGSLARVKVHFVQKSRFTGKNKRGAFSFTVTVSHVFNK
jgi:hypothetical protein